MLIGTFAWVVTGGNSKGCEKGEGVGVEVAVVALAELTMISPSAVASASAIKIGSRRFNWFSIFKG
jgi:hypothetical protein